MSPPGSHPSAPCAAQGLDECSVCACARATDPILFLVSVFRLFYRPEQSGLTKTAAARATLTTINPDVAFETYDYNIVTVANFEDFLQRCALDRPPPGRVRGRPQFPLTHTCAPFAAAQAQGREC